MTIPLIVIYIMLICILLFSSCTFMILHASLKIKYLKVIHLIGLLSILILSCNLMLNISARNLFEIVDSFVFVIRFFRLSTKCKITFKVKYHVLWRETISIAFRLIHYLCILKTYMWLIN